MLGQRIRISRGIAREKTDPWPWDLSLGQKKYLYSRHSLWIILVVPFCPWFNKESCGNNLFSGTENVKYSLIYVLID